MKVLKRHIVRAKTTEKGARKKRICKEILEDGSFIYRKIMEIKRISPARYGKYARPEVSCWAYNIHQDIIENVESESEEHCVDITGDKRTSINFRF